MNNDWIKEMQEKFVNHGEFLYNRGSYPATFGEVKQFIQSLLDKQIEEIYNDLSNNSKKINNSFNFIEKYVSMNYIRRLLTN